MSFAAGQADALADAIASISDRLRVDRAGVAAAVGATIARYTCDAAVHGTLEALDAAIDGARRRVRHEEMLAAD
jgi:hypothetical protein